MTLLPPLRETWRSETRGIGRIESELVKLEHALALAQAEEETSLPARTSVLNLVVYATDEASLARASDAVARLAGRHPSRTIYILPGASASGEVEAELRAHCLNRIEGLARICVEEIRIRTAPLRAGHLPELVSPLLIADLPTFAWHPHLEAGSGDVLAGLAELADHVVVDSSAAEDPLATLRGLAPFARQVTDFSWLRLLPWCELTAQFFDSESSRRYLDQLTTVQIEYAAPSSAAAVLYGGWLADRLGWEPFTEDRAPLVRFFRPGDDPGQYALLQLFPAATDSLASGSLLGIVATAQRPSAAPARFQLRRGATGNSVQTLTRLPNGRVTERTAPLPSPDVSALLADALDHTEPMRLYQYALASAVKLIR